jgi:hypothetical protein
MRPKLYQNQNNLNPYSISRIRWDGQNTISRYCPFIEGRTFMSSLLEVKRTFLTVAERKETLRESGKAGWIRLCLLLSEAV